MLNHISRICKPILLLLPRASFGGTHHDHGDHHGHDHHDHPIIINKQATWIKYKTNRRLACVDGVIHSHIPLPELIEQDAFGHIRNVPWYNQQRFFYGDAFHHSLEHDANSTTIQGYAVNDDPNDARFDMMIPVFYTVGALIAVFGLKEYGKLFAIKNIAEIVAEADFVEELIDVELRKKSDKIKQLEKELGLQTLD